MGFASDSPPQTSKISKVVPKEPEFKFGAAKKSVKIIEDAFKTED